MLKDENTRLRVLAEHDWLTGLYNRRAAEAHVDEALSLIHIFEKEHP